MSASDVFVVRRETDGVWEADCIDQRCGFGIHGVAETDSEAEALQAAAEHRRELAQINQMAGIPAPRCRECGQRIPNSQPRRTLDDCVDRPVSGPSITTKEQQVANLLALPNDTFQTLVEKNLGQDAQPLLWDLLTSRDVVRRTYNALTACYNDVCDQLAQRKAEMAAFQQECFNTGPDGKQTYFAAIGEHEEWRSRALGYRRLLSARITETKGLLATAKPTPPNPNKRIRLMETVFNLGWAIREHRDASLDAGVVPEPHDEALWDALERIMVETVDGPITVADMLDDLASKPGFVPPNEREVA